MARNAIVIAATVVSKGNATEATEDERATESDNNKDNNKAT
jgi:hypothetical protein